MTPQTPYGCHVSSMRCSGALGRDRESVQLARQAHGEVADVDHLLHLAATFLQELAGLERHQQAESVLGRTQRVAIAAHQLAAPRRGHVAPSPLGCGRAGVHGIGDVVRSWHGGRARGYCRRSACARTARRSCRRRPDRGRGAAAATSVQALCMAFLNERGRRHEPKRAVGQRRVAFREDTRRAGGTGGGVELGIQGPDRVGLVCHTRSGPISCRKPPRDQRGMHAGLQVAQAAARRRFRAHIALSAPGIRSPRCR